MFGLFEQSRRTKLADLHFVLGYLNGRRVKEELWE